MQENFILTAFSRLLYCMFVIRRFVEIANTRCLNKIVDLTLCPIVASRLSLNENVSNFRYYSLQLRPRNWAARIPWCRCRLPSTQWWSTRRPPPFTTLRRRSNRMTSSNQQAHHKYTMGTQWIVPIVSSTIAK
jgi:hypothetical protein